jgi:hypothetical protein
LQRLPQVLRALQKPLDRLVEALLDRRQRLVERGLLVGRRLFAAAWRSA